MFQTRSLVLSILLFATYAAAAQDAKNTPEHRAQLAEEKKYSEALEAYKAALAQDPNNATLMYNAGLMAYLAEKPQEAAEFWSREKALEPNNWRLRAKLVQAYEAVGNAKQRDAEREGLLQLREKSKDEELKKLKYYCRDQFTAGKDRVMVFEHFELAGDHAVRLRFLVLGPDCETVQAKYSLGSSRQTVELARSLKEIGPDDRLFHLDGYLNGGRSHRTYTFYKNEPKYDDVKNAVKEILEGKRKPTSGIDAPHSVAPRPQ